MVDGLRKGIGLDGNTTKRPGYRRNVKGAKRPDTTIFTQLMALAWRRGLHLGPLELNWPRCLKT